MLRRRYYLGLGLIALLIAVAVPAWAVKTVEMPENFGTDQWAMSHYRDAVDYLKYITKKDVQQRLLAVPENLRQQAWDEFWAPYDPVKKTPDNEFKTEYFKRIRYANENYGSILQPGWLTDRGEAYVRMGPPSDIERYTMRSGGHDMEIWVYINTSHQVNLFFVDRTGVGDFYLLNPTDMIEESYIYGH